MAVVIEKVESFGTAKTAGTPSTAARAKIVRENRGKRMWTLREIARIGRRRMEVAARL